jgi:hypothetical protein
LIDFKGQVDPYPAKGLQEKQEGQYKCRGLFQSGAKLKQDRRSTEIN